MLVSSAGALLALLSPRGVDAQSNLPVESFWYAEGDVNGIDRLGSRLYLVGSFDVVGPYTGNSVRIDAATGVVATPYPKFEGTVGAVVADGAGGWFVGGAFTRVGGVTRNHLAHILADGRVSSFDPNPDATVTAFWLVGRRLYVAGAFTNIGGQPRNRLALLDAATGAVDAWNPSANNAPFALQLVGNTLYVGGFFTTMGGQPRNFAAAVDATTGALLPFNPNAGAIVRAVAVSGSRVFLGGDFLTMGGQSRLGLAAVDATTGALDPWTPLSSNFVQGLTVGEGVLYVGGSFFMMSGQPRNRLAAFDATSLALSSWNPNVTGQFVSKIERVGSTVYLGGAFTAVGGQDRSGLAAVDASTGLLTSWNPVSSQGVSALDVSGGAVFAGGTSQSFGGQVRHRAAALDATTGVGAAWNPVGSNVLTSVATSPSAVYIGGQFTTVGGQSRLNIAATDPVTGALLPWNPGASQIVLALKVVGSNVYAGGDFTTIGGQPRNRLAAVDTSTAVPTSFDPNADAGVRALVVGASTLYVGGLFANIGGQLRGTLAEFSLATGAITSWNPVASGGGTQALALRGSTILAGGDFTSVGVQPRNRAAAIDLSGAPTGWDPNASSTVRAFLDLPTRVLAGGSFTTIGGQTLPWVAALDPTTGANLGWSPALSSSVQGLATNGNFVYAAGTFGAVGGKTRRGIAAFCLTAPATGLGAVGGVGQIDLSWTGSGAPSYNVYRSRSASGPFDLIASSATTSFSDTGLSGGLPYSYLVKAFDQCESDPTNVASASAIGACTLPPDFDSGIWIEQVASPSCALEVGWPVASPPCGGGVSYSVYRGITPDFTPSIATRVATLSGTTYVDLAGLAPGTTYYYVVRATGSANGQEDQNLIRVSAVPASCAATAPDTAEFLTVTSRNLENVLTWQNPPGSGNVRIRMNSGASSCTFPTSPTGSDGSALLADVAGTAGLRGRFVHDSLSDPAIANDTQYCYTLWVDTGTFSAGRSNNGRPFSTTGPVKWAVSLGTAVLAPPGNGGGVVHAVSNDSRLHSLVKGPAGGDWPTGWTPRMMNGPSQGRPAGVAVAVGAASPVLFLGSQDGHVYAFDASTGAPAWSPSSPLLGVMVQAGPSGIFTTFGGSRDYLLVGTRDAGLANRFYALNLSDGSVAWSYNGNDGVVDRGRIGIVSGQAAVDYQGGRVFFASRSFSGAENNTVWCIDLATGQALWAKPHGDVDAGLSLRGNRLYLGAFNGIDHEVRAIDADTGGTLWVLPTGDGPMKGFVMTDRLTNELYFSTTGRVWAIADTGAPTPKWGGALGYVSFASPSPAIFAPADAFVYVGGAGNLYRLSEATGSVVGSFPLGDGNSAVGSPTLDLRASFAYVGTDEGVVYAIALP